MITVVITLGEGTLPGLGRALRDGGFAVRQTPLLSFGPPRERAPFDAAMARLERYAAIALTSPRAAEAFRTRWTPPPRPAEWSVSKSRLWVVGAGTARGLGSGAGWCHRAARRRGRETAAEALARTMLDAGVGSPVLHLCGDVHRDEVSTRLRAAGMKVDEVQAYRSTLATPAAARRACMEAGAVVVGSPRVAALLARSIPAADRPILIALGPTTASVAAQFGWRAAAVARRPTVGEVRGAVRRGLELRLIAVSH